MNKCIGCGAILQNNDDKKEGYIKNINSNLCERCFRIKNYNDYKIISKDNNDFEYIFDDINNTNDLVILVTDVFHLNIMNLLNKIKNPILLVINKRDVLPKKMNENRLLNYINSKQIIDKVIISSYKNYNLDLLYNKINLYKKSKNVYIIGYTNVGKSTLINKLLYNYSENDSYVTTSLIPSTTLSTIEIELNKDLLLIDTPGLINEGDVFNILDIKLLKKIMPKKEIKPITYQANKKQYIIIENVFEMEVDNVSTTIYISNSLNIDRLYKYKDLDNKIKISKDEDLVIEGLGFLTFNKDVEIKYNIYNDIRVYKRKSL